MAEEPKDDPEVLKQYLDERKLLVEHGFKAYGDFDKLVGGVAAGALGVTAAFMKDIVPIAQADCRTMLALGWMTLAFSIITSLASIWVSARAYDDYREALDEAAAECGRTPQMWAFADRKQAKSVFAIMVRPLNVVSFLSVLVGLALLMAFIYINLSK